MRALRVAATLLGLLLPSMAWAQATVLQAGPWAPGHVPVYVGNGLSQPVVMDGGPAGGGGVGTGASEIGLVSPGTGTPPYANGGTGPFGTNVCDYDAPITNATGYHYLCFGPNADGGGLIAYGAAGSATQLPLTLNINGTPFTFPGTGTGDVAGPGTSVVGDLAVWNNTAGTLLKDVGINSTLQFDGSGKLGIDLATENTWTANINETLAYVSKGSHPTATGAGGTCAGAATGGAVAGIITLTGACAATNTITLSVMPTAPTGYSCDAVDRTQPATLAQETSTSVTTAVLTVAGTTSGATDVIQFKCLAY